MFLRVMLSRLAALSIPAALLLASANARWEGGEPQDPPAAQNPAGRDPDAAATCGQCHTEFYEEWKDRAHAIAWTDPVYQEELKEKTVPKNCHGCHIPGDVHARLGRKPEVRTQRLDEGVTCVSCHKTESKKGVILGPFGSKTDAHPSEKSPVFDVKGSTQLCASCHSTKILPVLPVARDHEEYVKQLGAEAKQCVECHMPEVKRHLAISIATGEPVGEERMTRSHVVLGPRDPDFCALAFEPSAKADDKEIVVSIANKTGHRVPGLTLRTFVVTVTPLEQDGKGAHVEKVEFSDKNELKTLETREIRVPRGSSTSVEVTIDHFFKGEKVATVLTKKLDL
jgi:hypothetical protein